MFVVPERADGIFEICILDRIQQTHTQHLATFIAKSEQSKQSGRVSSYMSSCSISRTFLPI